MILETAIISPNSIRKFKAILGEIGNFGGILTPFRLGW